MVSSFAAVNHLSVIAQQYGQNHVASVPCDPFHCNSDTHHYIIPLVTQWSQWLLQLSIVIGNFPPPKTQEGLTTSRRQVSALLLGTSVILVM